MSLLETMQSAYCLSVSLCFYFLSVSSFEVDPTRVTQLLWRPRVFSYEGFLSHEECDHIINLARNKLEKSSIVDDETGESIIDEYRTSSGMFLETAQDEIVANIEARIAAWTFLPIENGEPIQVLRYEHGEKYSEHIDYFEEKINLTLGGDRAATVLLYLTTVQKGGETVFLKSPDKEIQPKDDTLSDCAGDGYAVKPKKGNALLFFSLHPDTTSDIDSVHASCPVMEGEKWCATKWIHTGDFQTRFNAEMSGGQDS